MRKLSRRESIQRLLLPVLCAFAVSFFGCGLSSPFIVNPPEGWEEEAERGMIRRESLPTPTPNVENVEIPDTRPSHEDEHNPVVQVLADIIGYPFRAVGYLARVLL
jgi:hypothetical protein